MATTSDMLQSGTSHIQHLDFKAENRDGALDAFEIFRRAVMRVMKDKRGAHPQERRTLDSIEPKQKYFQFLLDFADRSFMHRSRVSEVIRRLLESPPWEQAASSNPAMFSAMQSLADECDASSQGKSSRDQSPEAKVEFGASAPVVRPKAASGPSSPQDPWSTRGRKATAEQFWLECAPQKKVPTGHQGIWGPISTERTATVATPSTPRNTNPFKTDVNTSSLKDVSKAPRSSMATTNPFKASPQVSPRRLASTNPFSTQLDGRKDDANFGRFPLYGRVS